MRRYLKNVNNTLKFPGLNIFESQITVKQISTFSWNKIAHYTSLQHRNHWYFQVKHPSSRINIFSNIKLDNNLPVHLKTKSAVLPSLRRINKTFLLNTHIAACSLFGKSIYFIYYVNITIPVLSSFNM